MPANDLVLNVRQIVGYPDGGVAQPTDAVLIQRGGLGGPYYALSAAELVSTALESGDYNMDVGGVIAAAGINTRIANIGQCNATLLSTPMANIGAVSADVIEINGRMAATQDYVDCGLAALRSATVWSFNGRVGAVGLWIGDIINAGGAPLWSPHFIGCPTADTPGECSNSNRLATTAFVQRNTVLYLDNFLRTYPLVTSINGMSGEVVLTAADLDLTGLAPLMSPAFIGTPTAPTVLPTDNSQSIATTAFVSTAGVGLLNSVAASYAPIVSPNFGGYPSAPTAPPGSSTAQLATTAFVMNAVSAATAGVASFNGRTGIVDLETADVTNAGGALLNSPVFTGTPQAPTVTANDNSNAIATTAWVINELGGAQTGVMTFNGRAGAVILTSADLSAAGGALLAGPAFTGVPTAPTAPTATSTQQIATTAFVEAAVQAGAVTSFNGRTGAITLTANDVSAAGALVNPSPALTGQPTAPTAVPGTNSTQIATTAFVLAALAAAGGVTSFNGRSGAITLTSADVNNAGGPYALASALANYLPLTGGSLTGSLGVGTTLPANAAVGSLILSGWLAVINPNLAGGVAANLYYDGTNWRYAMAGAGGVYTMSAGGHSWFSAVSGAAGAVASIVGQMSLTGTATTNLFVGSATASATSILSLIGNGFGSATFSNSAGRYVNESAGSTTVTNNWWKYFQASSGARFWQTWAGSTNMSLDGVGNLYIAGAYQQASDARGKRDIKVATEGMAVVRQLNPVTYHRVHPDPPPEHPGWTGPDSEELGFVAQEVQPVLPDAVIENPSGMLGVALMPLIAALTNAVKELDARLTAMEAAA
jgi:hypothetical protein